MEQKKQQITVVGAGVTGIALCRYFLGRKMQVCLSDRRSEEALLADAGIKNLVEQGVLLDAGGHSEAQFIASRMVVLSPGVPSDTALLQKVRAAGIPVLGEIEIAAREIEAPLVAITGTNGKSTVTSLIGVMLRAWRQNVFVGGNLGTPLIEAAGYSWDYAVAELSSFQLETVDLFHPAIAVILNLAEDHLDRYTDFAAYTGAKKNLLKNMESSDAVVYNAADPLVCDMVADCPAEKISYSTDPAVTADYSCDGRSFFRAGEKLPLPLLELKLVGLHNMENVLTALAAALHLGCPVETAWKEATEFGGLPHRMEKVLEQDGILWLNDSKGTNVASVVKGLEGLTGSVTLIAGGKDKQGDYQQLRPLLQEKVAHLILIGAAADKMEKELHGATRIHRCTTLGEAVTLAAELTVAGTVLLSPGCSSFDQFKNFAERGDVFTRCVLQQVENG